MDVQDAVDQGVALEYDPEDCIAELEKFEFEGDLGDFLRFYRGLEILTPQWKSRLDMPADHLQWQPGTEKLACYLVDRYWLQAVSDCDILCRVKFIIAACILVTALGGNLMETAQLFSKEIENDPDNVEKILDSAYTSPALTDANLLGLLLG